MDHWKILGLDGPTDDIKAIKKAYSKKLKLTRPDTDPTGFMNLRQAYERCHKAAQSQLLQHTKPPQISQSTSQIMTDDTVVNIAQDKVLNASSEDTPKIDQAAIDARNKFLDDYYNDVDSFIESSERKNIQEWMLLLQKRIDFSLEEYSNFEKYLLQKLINLQSDRDVSEANIDRPIPVEVMREIFKEMRWADRTMRPTSVQSDLLWLRDKAGLKRDIRETNPYPAITGRSWFMSLALGCILAVVLMFSYTLILKTKPGDNPDVTPENVIFEAQYGDYKRIDDSQFSYTLKSHPEVIALNGDEQLKDQFKILWNNKFLTEITVTIHSKDHRDRVEFSQDDTILPKTSEEKKHEIALFIKGLLEGALIGYILLHIFYLINDHRKAWLWRRKRRT
ncbi:MAG: J domain-containing protein [Maricaulaceae bacterium]